MEIKDGVKAARRGAAWKTSLKTLPSRSDICHVLDPNHGHRMEAGAAFPMPVVIILKCDHQRIFEPPSLFIKSQQLFKPSAFPWLYRDTSSFTCCAMLHPDFLIKHVAPQLPVGSHWRGTVGDTVPGWHRPARGLPSEPPATRHFTKGFPDWTGVKAALRVL